MQLTKAGYRLSENINPVSLCQKYGTPIYIYDADIIERQYKRMINAFDVPNFRLNYAVKALSNINILRFFRQLGAGLDCVSIQEIELGLRAGFLPHDIIFTPSSVSLEEMRLAQEKGVHINIDSIPMLESFGAEFPDVPIGLRFNPHVYAGGNRKISVGHVNSKFGISIHQIPHVLRIVEQLNLKIEGVHIHTGSDILDTDVFLAATEILFNTAREFKDLAYIDFGSGFKVGYKEGDNETDIELLGQKFSQRFKDFCEEYGKDLTLMFEPGKYMVSEAGTFLVQTNIVKQTTAAVFAGVNSGLNHLIRPMFYDAYHHIVNISNPFGKKRIYSIVGYICETDTFGVDRQISEIKEGDYLAIFNAGAYGMMMASNYNSRPRPAEVLVYQGKDHLIRKKESLDDLLRNQVDIEL